MKNTIKLSVRNLVEFIMRSGDIDNTFTSKNKRAVEGTIAHGKVQNSYGKGYRSEVKLKHKIDYEEYSIELEGRADGIYEGSDQVIIDEIKSTTRDLESLTEDYNMQHWAQAKCYGYIYAVQNKLENIKVQLTYFHIETEEIKQFIHEYNLSDIEEFFMDLIRKYIDWANFTFEWTKIRDDSIKDLSFPFKDYRKGQRELAVAVYRTIAEGKNISVQAPTGTGKTMSNLFPAIKSMGEGLASKIFYLTAKTVTSIVPRESMKMMSDKGLRMKSLSITAKDKICLNDQVKCNPRDCEYAKGHFDRVNDAIMAMIKEEDIINRDKVIEYSKKHRVCPFEYQLDVALWSDIIICDYNYVFDPQVYLRRFFDISDNYIFLIDEAHNLVDRSREMYSTELNLSSFESVKDLFKEKYKKIYNDINRCIDAFDRIRIEYDVKEKYYQKEEIDELYYPVKTLITSMEKWLIDEKEDENNEDVLELYFNLLSYILISDFYDEHYVSYVENNRDLKLKIYCVDSSYMLSKILERSRTSVLFSATLTPLEYYKELLGANSSDYHMRLTSPFDKENLHLLINHRLSTKYKDREYSYENIADNIYEFTNIKKGNYMIFFPSYKYMELVYEYFSLKYGDRKHFIQSRNMNENEREEFLEEFDKNNDIIAFVVMGGIFSEGIDLVDDKLIGAVIVGVGLPMISFENNIIKEYFNKNGKNGFDYAYVYPGMNKVLQAAGRVIRSEEDRGAILLIDSRYATRKYRNLYPREWFHFKLINKNSYKELEDFWKDKKELE